jgi:hypothetical protein
MPLQTKTSRFSGSNARDVPRFKKKKVSGQTKVDKSIDAVLNRPPKKAPKPSTAIVPVGDKLEVREGGKKPRTTAVSIRKAEDALKKATTTFGVPAKKLFTMIQDGHVDQAVITFQRQMLATMLSLIPIAEAEYRTHKKEHTAYALNSLISQARELTADIQSSADRAQVAEIIVLDYIMPTFKAFIETMVMESIVLKASLKSKVKNPEAGREADEMVNVLVRAVARQGNELFRVNANSIRDLLGAPKKRGVSKT